VLWDLQSPATFSIQKFQTPVKPHGHWWLHDRVGERRVQAQFIQSYGPQGKNGAPQTQLRNVHNSISCKIMVVSSVQQFLMSVNGEK
jgi:hypothetical protein